MEEDKTKNLQSHPISTASSNSLVSRGKQVETAFSFQTQNRSDSSYLTLNALTPEADTLIPQMWPPSSLSDTCYNVTAEGLSTSDQGSGTPTRSSSLPGPGGLCGCLSVPPQGLRPARPACDWSHPEKQGLTSGSHAKWTRLYKGSILPGACMSAQPQSSSDVSSHTETKTSKWTLIFSNEISTEIESKI